MIPAAWAACRAGKYAGVLGGLQWPGNTPAARASCRDEKYAGALGGLHERKARGQVFVPPQIHFYLKKHIYQEENPDGR